jgi:hypothetical protein
VRGRTGIDAVGLDVASPAFVLGGRVAVAGRELYADGTADSFERPLARRHADGGRNADAPPHRDAHPRANATADTAADAAALASTDAAADATTDAGAEADARPDATAVTEPAGDPWVADRARARADVRYGRPRR